MKRQCDDVDNNDGADPSNNKSKRIVTTGSTACTLELQLQLPSVHTRKQQQQQQIPPALVPVIRMMLHTEDGMVPYLTPDVLERYFPCSSSSSNEWCLGMAISETCMTPIFHPNNNTKSKKKQQQRKGTATTTKKPPNHDQNNNTTTATTSAMKPRGYEFSSHGSYQLDGWLYPYERIVVPTFETEKRDRNQNSNKSSSSSSTNKTLLGKGDSCAQVSLQESSVSTMTGLKSKSPLQQQTAHVVRLWTSNGRHTINARQYIDCAMNAIHANCIVPLYHSDDAVVLDSVDDVVDDDRAVVVADTTKGNAAVLESIDDMDKNDCSQKRLIGKMNLRSHLKQQQRMNWIQQHMDEIIIQLQNQQSHEAQLPQQQQSLNKGNTMNPNSLPQLCVPLVVSDQSCCHNATDKNNNIESNVSDSTKRQLLEVMDRVRRQGLYSNIDNDDDGRNNNSILLMLIGWHTITNVNQRWNILQSLYTALSTTTISKSIATMGTIATSSTQQLLQLILYSTLGDINGRVVDMNSSTNNNISNHILIGTNLPTIWARTKRCFVIAITSSTILPTNGGSDDDKNDGNADDTNVAVPKLDVDGCYDFNPTTITTTTSSTDGSTKNNNTNNKVQHDHIFYSDSSPLMDNCDCLTCQTYTRAYLYHLVCAQELLAEILFFIHNLHHMLHLIRVMNVFHTNNDMESIKQLCSSIQSQLG